MKDAIRSCARGLGPDKQSQPIDLSIGEVEPLEQGPDCPKDVVILFALFACREVEAAVRQAKRIQVEQGPGCGKVSLFLPASKTDPKGDGVLRQLGCACKHTRELCPVAAALRLLQNAREKGRGPEDPLLVCPDKKGPEQGSDGEDLQASGSGSRL